MPSEPYNNDEQQPENQGTDAKQEPGAPEPPVRYDANRQPMPVFVNPGNQSFAALEYQKINRLLTAAQIMAPVSLFIGGVLLSGAAVIVSIIARQRSSAMRAQELPEAPLWILLNKRAMVAIVMSLIALAVNVVALVYLYPMMVEMMQTGDYSSLFGGGQASAPSGNSGGSVWG